MNNIKIDYKEKHANDLLKKTKIKIVDLKKLVNVSDIIFVPIQTPHDKKYEGINDIPKSRKDFDYTYLKKGIKIRVGTQSKFRTGSEPFSNNKKVD